MEELEKIKVYIRTVKGKTVCICKADSKRCKKHCEEDIVTRDRYRDWEKIFARDKYGRMRD